MFYGNVKNEILSEINKVEIINPHTHLKEDCLTSNVVDILSYHWILSELNSVGLNCQEIFSNKNYDLDARLKCIIPYFSRMKNTATARCVYSIFADLYDFHEDINDSNYKTLLDKSLTASSDPNWPDAVFKKTNIVSFATGAGNASSNGNQRQDFNLMVEINYLCWPAGSTDNLPWFKDFALDETKYLDAIEKIGERDIGSITDIKASLQHFLNNALQGRVKFFATYLPIEFRFGQVDDQIAERALRNFRKSEGHSKEDLDVLVKFVTWNILEILNEIKTTLQVAVGAEYFICGGRSLSRYESTWVSDMAKVCYVFPNIKFDFMNASAAMTHEMEVAAKMIRNFHIQNMWWHTYVPSCMNTLYEKLEVVPVVKLGAFYCDAYYCELTYGKLQMVKESIAEVLARKVENKIFTTDYAIEIAGLLLNSNQKALYGI